MIKNDFTEKLAIEFTALMEKITSLKNLKKDTLPIINESFKGFFGFSSSIINSLSEEDLIPILKGIDALDGTKYVIMAALLKEEATIYEDHDNSSAAYYRYLKSFNIFYEVIYNNLGSKVTDYYEHLNYVISKLTSYNLPIDTYNRIFECYKHLGNFAKAEDILYHVIDTNENKDMYTQKALVFYNELLEKDDATLEKGNLPRHEIKEALESLM